MNFFYSKFALNNLVKNKKFILPYILAAIFTIGSFYMLSSMVYGSNLDKLPNGIDATKKVLAFGSIVIALFSIIFLFYTYSFLIKRRVREFGLYSVLGMTKKQIAKILVLETIFIAGITLVLGLGFGMLFDKIALLSLLKLFTQTVPFGFNIPFKAIESTVLLFLGIYFILLVYTIIKISRLKIINLLNEENKGEKEPKARWILVILGLILIGYGYYTAMTIENPVKALKMFLFAVLAVILGTYLIFIAISIAVLKIMKNNKNFYYKPKNFISVSGLLYRMKRNAVGLANICILSTMILVTMGATSALYAGSENSFNIRYPKDINIEGHRSSAEKLKEIEKNAKKVAKDAGVEVRDLVVFNQMELSGSLEKDKFNFRATTAVNPYSTMLVAALSDYNKLVKDKKTLKSGEILLHIDKKDEYNYNNLNIQGLNFTIKEKLSKYPGELGSAVANIMTTYYVIVNDNEVNKIGAELVKITKDEDFSRIITNSVGFNISDKTKESEIIKNFKKLEKENNIEVEGKSENKDVFKGFYSSFLFIGAFISMIFVVFKVVIMYYKQISEGYEDKDKFEIMKKVGLTDKQIKQSINSQILLIFFSPLIIATIHTAVAYPFVKKILKLFLVSDMNVFLIAMIATVGIFTLFYLIVYLMTSRIYYRMIKE